MRKTLLLIILVIISIFLGYSLAKSSFKVPNVEKDANQETEKVKRLVLKFAIVSDSGGENDLLTKALPQAQGKGINFVIGLGDWTTVGTLEQLSVAKQVFDDSKLEYYVTAGDHDLWASRNQDNDPLSNFNQTFGKASHLLEKDRIQIVILDNSDIYKGIPSESWELLFESLKKDVKLRFVMAHKTPFHPDSAHIMGQDAQNVKAQAENLLAILEEGQISGFFSGDMHFFAQFKTPKQAVKITTIGAVASQKNFQGPRFGIVTVYDDYSWKAEDVEIR
ncbi:hypothetical protein A3D07_02290 [Candidatus Curtissbacteria bacterium RIFCSPHIGHO2_02_FULL_42_15]|uniref:Calcineurin-like phosphoesterase domain-containing protein n=1 Tax=Candidatus Curtissbacteria bacterium RIFCSPHIGHO2_02_FULL_42_15 TaxID=1797716 RepID=A0A1F5GH02_9BACT|nr:MAG: hypothetical protein A3D07_02290 [Candidatus Curtissbacteria bacterium RIFCSPHIGHO2_02_FULL_42_15]